MLGICQLLRRRGRRPRILAQQEEHHQGPAIVKEELFGPAVRTYCTIDEVIDYVNGRPRPLALYHFGTFRGDIVFLA